MNKFTRIEISLIEVTVHHFHIHVFFFKKKKTLSVIPSVLLKPPTCWNLLEILNYTKYGGPISTVKRGTPTSIIAVINYSIPVILT